jgi:hypothetical protein
MRTDTFQTNNVDQGYNALGSNVFTPPKLYKFMFACLHAPFQRGNRRLSSKFFPWVVHDFGSR